MELTTLLFLGFFAAVALLNYTRQHWSHGAAGW